MERNMDENFKAVITTLTDTFKAKNADYGSAVDITYLMFGEVAQLVRLWDKLLRITQLHLSQSSQVKEESVRDTLTDLANYSIIALAQHRTYGNAPDPQLLGEAMSDFASVALLRRDKNRDVIGGDING